MNRRLRMVYVLSSLAAAMASTASLLAWMAPSLPPAPNETPVADVLGIARSLVTEDARVQAARWQRVEIVPGSMIQHAQAILPSTPPDEGFDFLIDDRGGLSRANAWHPSSPGGRGGDTVRVRLAPSPAGQILSHRQRAALTALLQALGEVAAPDPRSTSIPADPTFSPAQWRASAPMAPNPLLARVTG